MNTRDNIFDLTDFIKINGVSKIIDDIEKLFDISVTFVNQSGKLVTRPSKNCKYCKLVSTIDVGKRCRESDTVNLNIAKETQKFHIFQCFAGLTDIIIPLFYKNIFVGAAMFGQIKQKGIFEPDFKMLFGYLSKNNPSGEKREFNRFKDAYQNAKEMELSQIRKIAGLLADTMNMMISLNYQELKQTSFIIHSRDLTFAEIIQKIKEYVEHHFNEDISLNFFAEQYDIKVSYLSKLFKKFTGSNFKDYLILKRLDEAKRLLIFTDENIIDIAFSVGFNDSNHFSVLFKKRVHVTPHGYRKKYLNDHYGNTGKEIFYENK